MTEEKKSAIRKRIALAEVLLAAVLLAYLIYGLITKNSNSTVFHVLAIILVVFCVICSDFLEPYLTKTFEEMDDFRKSAYKNYVFWDVISMGGILLFALTFTEGANMVTYLGIAAYFVGANRKRTYRGAYLGEVTKEDVETAKKSVIDGEAKEITVDEEE